jgi:hypothetical protein
METYEETVNLRVKDLRVAIGLYLVQSTCISLIWSINGNSFAWLIGGVSFLAVGYAWNKIQEALLHAREQEMLHIPQNVQAPIAMQPQQHSQHSQHSIPTSSSESTMYDSGQSWRTNPASHV